MKTFVLNITKCDIRTEQKPAIFLKFLKFSFIASLFLQLIKSGQPKFQPNVMNGIGDIALNNWNSSNVDLYNLK